MPTTTARHCTLPLMAGLALTAMFAIPEVTFAQEVPNALHQRIDAAATAIEPKVVAWRRDLHQYPELGNREVRTARVIADHLRSLGLEVRTGVAATGVVGVLKGGRPGPVVALRADMDGLPVTEQTDLPFKSTVKAEYNGQQVGVMHACGHDMHMSILMGAADVLSQVRADLPGTVVFVFQPAEEGAPDGEDGGAERMIKEGALDAPKVDAIFGLHVFPGELGKIGVRPHGIMAGGDTLRIRVRGRQTHGAMPWGGVDPIVVSAQIVLGLQTIVSRQVDLTGGPAAVTIGTIHGGNRRNIIPDEVELVGTIRTFDPAVRTDVLERVRRTAERIAESSGATAEVTLTPGYPVTWNDPALTTHMMPSLRRVAGNLLDPAVQVTMGSEDFSLYQRQVPGVFFFLFISPKGTDPKAGPMNHSPLFSPDEGALIPGVRAMASLAADYLLSPLPAQARGSSAR